MTYPVETDKWVLLQAEDKDGPLVVRLNQGIDAIRGHKDFAHQVGIAIPLRKPNHVGFPDRPEGEELKAVEAALIPALEQDQDSVCVLVLTGNGVREFVLYTRSPTTVQQRIRELAKAVTTHEVQSIVQHDPDWEVYDGYSVPQSATERERAKQERAEDTGKFPHMVLARFYENVEPIDRGERYEDPLQAALERENLGAVTGGGSQLSASGPLAYADIEMLLADTDRAVDLAVRALEGAGALRGSEILHGGKVIREFGKLECVAIFLDGINLPQEVYDNLDFDDLLSRLEAAAGEKSFRGTWQGNEETGLFYGCANADETGARIESTLRQIPIGENARLVMRYGKDSLNPRTIKLTR